jgi:4-amino-4-deoxy-L-arabinose transferase-like glycosyltransferase
VTLVRRIPLPLAALLAVVLMLGFAWALLVPPGQVPDEPQHIQYAQTIAERHELPGKGPNVLSDEEGVGLGHALDGTLPGDPAKKPPWSQNAYTVWRSTDSVFVRPDYRQNGGGYIWQGDNPPLYYAYEAATYRAVGGDFFDRLYGMRMFSALLLLATATGAWLLAGELFGRNRLLQLVAAAVAGLQPMVTFVSAGINPDAGLYAFWSVSLWLGARVIMRGLTLRDGVALGLVAGFAFTEKSTSLALLPAALLAITVGYWRVREADPRARAAALASVAALALPVLAWAVMAGVLDRRLTNQAPRYTDRHTPSLTNVTDVRMFLSYVWQFYLPRPSFLTPAPLVGNGGDPLYFTWMKSGWAAFGWLEVRLPDWVYKVLAILSAGALVAGLGAAVRSVVRDRRLLWVAAFFAIAGLGLLFIVHWAEFTIVSLENIPFIQGRYILPLIPLGGAAVAGAISLLPLRGRAVAAGLVVGGLLVLQLASLGVNLGRYFA